MESHPIHCMILYILCVLTTLLAIDYAFFIRDICKTWNDHEEFSPSSDKIDTPFISIVIAARNEENRISQCLNSISANDYPKSEYEIILVDDHSEDDTKSIAEGLNISNLQVCSLMSLRDQREHVPSYKKEALKRGVEKAKGSLILFTDADVLVPPLWIRTMSRYILEKEVDLVTGPIRYQSNPSILQQFQALDIAGTLTWTASGIWSQKTYLANGANMIIQKSAYFKYHNQAGDDQASGDDVFLIQSIAAESPNRVDFIKSKNAIATTFPENTWKKLIIQRLRWASKTSSYSNKRLQLKIGKIFAFNFSLFTLFIVGFLCASWLTLAALGCFVLKICLDFYLINHNKLMFTIRQKKRYFPFFVLIHSIFIISIGSAAILNFKGSWKGRNV